ncbi:MAG: tRNA epoxyqueuosine(34) reductase QueG [Magnetococcales bacterium]|nr:tRNA epoxyqueuosine(34) reductase QueG [Magnetococcales bacterium]
MIHSTNLQQKRKEQLKRIAQEEGFDVVSFASPAPPPRAEFLTHWLERGSHGDMVWMEHNPHKRMDPNQLMEKLGCIMVLGLNYRPPGEPSPYLSDPGALGISAYARNREYQGYIKKKLKKMASRIEQTVGRSVEGRIFVDTAPVLEKPLAAGAGLGWQGKNSFLVNRNFGCWLFLAEFFLDLDLPPDPPDADHCGRCERCQVVCPTGALDTPWQLDAQRCLAYLSIESSGPIPRTHRQAMGNRVFGCDDCLTACPWNRFAPVTKAEFFLPRAALVAPRLLDFVHLDEADFRSLFSQSGIKRSGRIRFMRNLAVALGNWATEEAFAGLTHLFADPHPLIRGHAAWGLGQITTPKARELLRSAQYSEPDQWVKEEILLALNQMVTSTRAATRLEGATD